jgi:hypothetical protein
MPAFTQPQRGLTVILYCDGFDPFEVTAKGAKHTAVVALGLISARGALNFGDCLIVRRADDPVARPARSQ